MSVAAIELKPLAHGPNIKINYDTWNIIDKANSYKLNYTSTYKDHGTFTVYKPSTIKGFANLKNRYLALTTVVYAIENNDYELSWKNSKCRMCVNFQGNDYDFTQLVLRKSGMKSQAKGVSVHGQNGNYQVNFANKYVGVFNNAIDARICYEDMLGRYDDGESVEEIFAAWSRKRIRTINKLRF